MEMEGGFKTREDIQANKATRELAGSVEAELGLVIEGGEEALNTLMDKIKKSKEGVSVTFTKEEVAAIEQVKKIYNGNKTLH